MSAARSTTDSVSSDERSYGTLSNAPPPPPPCGLDTHTFQSIHSDEKMAAVGRDCTPDPALAEEAAATRATGSIPADVSKANLKKTARSSETAEVFSLPSLLSYCL